MMFEQATPDFDDETTTVAEFFDGARVVSVSKPGRRHVYRYVRRGQVIGEADTLLGITRCVFDAVEVRRRR